MEVLLETFGEFACFTLPYGKVERISAPFPTPSAARGILSAIYSKPAEFYWQINRIEVLNPISYITFKRNEIKSTTRDKPIYTDEQRTQRQTTALHNVRYRIAASICPQAGFHGSESHLYDQALRRIRRGQCFYQPCFGLREFVAYFEESDGKRTPIPMDMDTGLAVYDVFDLHDHRVHKKAVTSLSLYHAVMTQGVITVPPYDSPGVIKGGTLC